MTKNATSKMPSYTSGTPHSSMENQKNRIKNTTAINTIEKLQEKYMKAGLNLKDLQHDFLHKENLHERGIKWSIAGVCVVLAVSLCFQLNILNDIQTYLLGVRCIIPNNYFIWEATRPISNCNFCSNITEALILPNLTRKDFVPYAYSSRPMVLKGAFNHWHAMKTFSFDYFKNLYARIEESYKSVDEECQFLHFKSNFISIRDVFEMSEARIKNKKGQKSWYVGWGNCHPEILEEMHKEYPKPHFLPQDSEVPYKDYVFMGYDDGATMHLDYINRLMWQGQLQGSKLWKILPPPECQHICQGFNFTVHPGDAEPKTSILNLLESISMICTEFLGYNTTYPPVDGLSALILVDTRMWYHGTRIFPGQFSLSVQSEYG